MTNGAGINARLIIGDFVQVADGKLTIVGGGWSFISPGPVMFGVGVLIEMVAAEVARPHTIELEVRDADGRPLLDPNGQPVRAGAMFTPQSLAPDHPGGMPVKTPLAFNFSGLPLPPASRFQVVLTVDHQIVVTEDFMTRPDQMRMAS